MKITINKDSDVPIRDQIIEQIGIQIASGTLKGKEKLPSIRALADRLGIHYSTVTAAYNHLADVGLLEVRQGSGVRVAGRAPTDTSPGEDKESLDELYRNFLGTVCDYGYSRRDLAPYIEKVVSARPVSRIVAVDRNRDFHYILLNELRPHFSIPIEALTVEEFVANSSLVDDSLIVTSLYHLHSFQDKVPDPTRLIACNIEPGRSEIETIVALPTGSLVVLVSESQTIMNMATKLVAANRNDIAVRSIIASDSTELQYVMRHADLIVCDRSSEAKVLPLAAGHKVRVLIFQLYAPSAIHLIKNRLEKWG